MPSGLALCYFLMLLSASPPEGFEDHQGNEHKTHNTDSYTDSGACG